MLTVSEREHLYREKMPSGGLFGEGEWRLSLRAFPMSDPEIKVMDQLGPWLAQFLKAADTLYKRSVKGSAPPYIADWLERGKPDELVAWSRECAGDGHLPRLVRPDLLLTDDGFVLTEIDSIPGGSGTLAWMNERYAEMGDPVLGSKDAADFLRQQYRDHDVVIAEEALAYRPELEWLYGNETVRAAEGYAFNSRPVYRFFEGFDWPHLDSLRRSFSPQVQMDPPLKVHLEEKLWQALFWLRPLRTYWKEELGGRYDRELRKLIPETWPVEPVQLPPHAVLPGIQAHSWEEVVDFTKSERDLVIKLSGFSPEAWGSRGVWMGSDMTAEEWKTCINESLAESGHQPRIMQPFHKARRVSHPVFIDGEERDEEFRARCCPFYWIEGGQSTLLGVHVTLCPPDKKRIHGMQDAVIVPACRGGLRD